MIKVGDKSWDSLEDNEKIAYVEDSLLVPAKTERRKFDWKWYVGHSFLQGNHYLYYNSVTNSIETPERKKGEVRLVINKARAQIRSVQNYVTRFDPKWETVPSDLDEETLLQAHYASKVLDHVYLYVMYMRSKVRMLTRDALVHHSAFFELAWDDNKAGGKGDVEGIVHDPFDILLPMTAYLEGPIIHSTFVGKVIRRPLPEVKSDERYNEKNRVKVVPEDELAYSEMKARLMQTRGEHSGGREGTENALVREVMLWDSEGNEKGGNIRLFTYAGGQVLRDEDMEDDEYPIYCFQAETTRSIYDISWLDTYIPINKVLNNLYSRQIEYVNKFNVGRFIGEKGHGVNEFSLNNTGGQVIEVNPNRRFEQLQMHPLPLTGDRLAGNVERLGEDVTGAHEASRGSMPEGARAGKILEQLQAADSNNLAGIRQSLEDFLAVVGCRTLKMISKKYVTKRVMKLAAPEDGMNYMQVIGKGAKNKPKNAIVLYDDNEVAVKVGSWLGHTKEAQRDTLIQLAEMGAISTEDMLRYFDFPNVEELSARARSQRLEQDEMKADIAGRRGGGQAEPTQAGQPGQTVAPGMGPDEAMADEENMTMMNGEQLPPTPNATPQHTQAHFDFLKSQMAAQNPDGAGIIEEHAMGEMTMQSGIQR